MVSLGCAKNRVDSEVILGTLKEAGYEIVSDPAEAEIIFVNTCGFIEPAKEESIEAIFEMAKYKETGRLQKAVRHRLPRPALHRRPLPRNARGGRLHGRGGLHAPAGNDAGGRGGRAPPLRLRRRTLLSTPSAC